MAFSKWSLVLGFGALGFLGCGGADGDEAGQELDTSEEPAELTAQRTFLSLGNSIAFGYSPLVGPPNLPSSYVGYPEVIASKGNKVTNASCPGETSSSFFSTDAPDNGCRAFKAATALHADYETTQIVFTLGAVKKTSYNFITLDIGANDLFLLQKKCNADPACIQVGLPGVIATYAQNLQKGYDQVKPVAKGKPKFIGLTTYALDYNDPLAVAALNALNGALVTFTKSIGGKVADGFDVFKKKAVGGDSCAAGLLIKLPDGTCDIHPSKAGAETLAKAILDVAN
jgi:hypothetical protein